jgi:FtsP/CotA-like multicopper oxidase with cupredoxin domain
LREARDELAAECDGDADRFAREWLALAERWDFHDVNDLIERHNRHYPTESRLPMNPRTGDFVLVNGRPYTREPIGAEWILERFPVA